jgi:hypothetical protein
MMSKLQEIAERMRTAIVAQSFGWTRKTLPGGLDLVLSHRGENWRLALRREKIYPSDMEAEILFKAFAVAEGTEPEKRQHTEEQPTTKRKIDWRIVEFNWIETDSTGATTA